MQWDNHSLISNTILRALSYYPFATLALLLRKGSVFLIASSPSHLLTSSPLKLFSLKICIFANFVVPLQHVYILPHILHHRATSLPYSGMATMLDHSTPMPSQHALCTICIYRIGARAALLRHHALWLLVRAKAIACHRNHLHFAASTLCLQRI